MPPYQSLSITTSDTLEIHFNDLSLTNELPRLDETVPPRLVFEIGELDNSLTYSIQVLKIGDIKAIRSVVKAANENSPGNLIDRSEKEWLEILTKDHVVGLVVNKHLAGFGVISLIDDEKQEGRGTPLQGYAVEEKAYLKSGAVHPSMQGIGIINKLYPYRLAIGVSYDERLVMATKTIEPKVAKGMIGNGWDLAQQDEIFVEQKGLLVPKTLETYVITRQNAIRWLKHNRADIFNRLPATHENNPASTINALTLH